MVRQFLVALLFLTRLPVKTADPVAMEDVARAAPFYPVVGVLTGAIMFGVLAGSSLIGIPDGVSLLLAMIAAILLTGALHEDGLSDVADGLGAIGSSEKRLAIMRDSRLGVYGALALITVLALRFSLYFALMPLDMMLPVLITAHGLSRASMTIPMSTLSPARIDGLAKQAGTLDYSLAVAALLIGMILAVICFAATGVAVAILGFVAAGGLSIWFYRSLNGQTGDCLGATQQLVEITVLLSIVVLVH